MELSKEFPEELCLLYNVKTAEEFCLEVFRTKQAIQCNKNRLDCMLRPAKENDIDTGESDTCCGSDTCGMRAAVKCSGVEADAKRLRDTHDCNCCKGES